MEKSAGRGDGVVWVYAILLVLSPALLYVVVGLLLSIYRERCPECGQRGLTCVNVIKATVAIDGMRAPDSWGYYSCEKCGASLKHHRGVWGPIPDDELHWCEEPRT
jgi:hypothetical protein